MLEQVDPVNDDFNHVAHGEDLLGFFAPQAPLHFLEVIEVAIEAGYVDEPGDQGIGKLHEHSEIHDIHDHGREAVGFFLLQLAGEELQFFEFHRFHFGIRGDPFHVRDMEGGAGQGVRRHDPFVRFQGAMDDEVGVATDR